jgi:suppressor of ftsI
MNSLSRRNFMTLATGAAAGDAASRVQAQLQAGMHRMPMEEAAPIPLQPGEQQFVPDITLELNWTHMTIDGLKVKVSAYTGQIPGPMMTTRAGVHLKVCVKNLLPRMTPANGAVVAHGATESRFHWRDHPRQSCSEEKGG